MKRLIVTCLLFGSFICLFAQNVWIADNRPTAPSGAHIFPDVAQAIAAASPGDIIHVTPSQFSYGNWTVSKDSLTIYGIGFNPDKEQPSVSISAVVTIANEVFGTRLSGHQINEIRVGDVAGGSLGNLFIENSLINRIYADATCCVVSSISNVIIRNCVIGREWTGGGHAVDLQTLYDNATSVVITNNVIANSSTTSGNGYGALNVTDALVRNNLFLGNNSGNDYAFNALSTSTVSNNIFYGTRPVSDGLTGTVNNSTFNNNISFGNTINSFPVGVNGNTGDTTQVFTFQDPLFVNVPVGDENWDFAWDPTLDVGSPAIGAGNDGSDIGLTGGTIPYSPTGSPLPVITVLRLPEIIQQGTNTNADIEAKGN